MHRNFTGGRICPYGTWAESVLYCDKIDGMLKLYRYLYFLQARFRTSSYCARNNVAGRTGPIRNGIPAAGQQGPECEK